MEAQYKSAQRLYDARAHKYDDSWHPSFARHLAQVAEPKAGDNVLDLACGTGLVTFNLATLVGPQGHVTAVDISSRMLEQANLKKTLSNVANVDIYQHDITRLDSLDAVRRQTFDIITIASALVLLDDPKAALRLWASFLKPKGRLVVDVISPDNLVSGLMFERTAKRLGLKVPYYREWVKSSEAVRDALEDANLVVQKIDPVAQTGAGLAYLDISDAVAIFDREVDGEAIKILATDDIRDTARTIFQEEWAKVAVNGKVKTEDLVWVAIASPTRSEKALREATDRS